MKFSTTWLFVAVLELTGNAAQADYDHNEIKRLRDAGEILSLETIIDNYRKRHRGGRIIEVELEFVEDRYVYELEILDDDGTVQELEYDARTGELRHGKERH
jgi:uncharacterized membrane protein YkoI